MTKEFLEHLSEKSKRDDAEFKNTKKEFLEMFQNALIQAMARIQEIIRSQQPVPKFPPGGPQPVRPFCDKMEIISKNGENFPNWTEIFPLPNHPIHFFQGGRRSGKTHMQNQWLNDKRTNPGQDP